MFPRAVLNPTRHMEKFMDMANVDNYLHDKHLYAITERGKKNLPENDASHGMRLLGGELVQYRAITDNGTIVTMVPAACVDGLTLLFYWLTTVITMFESPLFFARPSTRESVKVHCAIIIGALNASIEAANAMWSLGIMTEEWFPWQLALIITYWNVFGGLDTSSWTTLVNEPTSTWMRISVSPRSHYFTPPVVSILTYNHPSDRDGLMYRTAYELKVRAETGQREMLVNSYFRVWEEIVTNSADGRSKISDVYGPALNSVVDTMNTLRTSLLLPALTPQQTTAQLESYALSCIEVCRRRYLPYGTGSTRVEPPLEDKEKLAEEVVPSDDVAGVNDETMYIDPLPAEDNFPESSIRSGSHSSTSAYGDGKGKGKRRAYQSQVSDTSCLHFGYTW
jgi:hypothetical protein